MSKHKLTALWGAALAALALPAAAAPVDLSDWLQDGNGNWVLAEDNDSVTQRSNSPPTVFHNGIDSQGLELAGTIEVQTGSDDDFIGFVLGYTQGDIDGNPDTDYLLIDWKQNTQSGWEEGLAISRVTGPIQAGGTDTGADAWQHDGNVEFITRANTLGTTGWEENVEYAFEIFFTSTLIRVTVDGSLEFELFGTFSDGAFGFYNFSQEDVRYAGITQTVVPVPPAIALLLPALGLLSLTRRRRRA